MLKMRDFRTDSIGTSVPARPLQTARAFPFRAPTPGVASLSASSLICFLDKIIVTTGALLVVALALAGALLAVAVATVAAVSAVFAAPSHREEQEGRPGR